MYRSSTSGGPVVVLARQLREDLCIISARVHSRHARWGSIFPAQMHNDAHPAFRWSTTYCTRRKSRLLLLPCTATRKRRMWAHRPPPHFLGCTSIVFCLLAQLYADTPTPYVSSLGHGYTGTSVLGRRRKDQGYRCSSAPVLQTPVRHVDLETPEPRR